MNKSLLLMLMLNFTSFSEGIPTVCFAVEIVSIIPIEPPTTLKDKYASDAYGLAWADASKLIYRTEEGNKLKCVDVNTAKPIWDYKHDEHIQKIVVANNKLFGMYSSKKIFSVNTETGKFFDANFDIFQKTRGILLNMDSHGKQLALYAFINKERQLKLLDVETGKTTIETVIPWDPDTLKSYGKDSDRILIPKFTKDGSKLFCLTSSCRFTIYNCADLSEFDGYSGRYSGALYISKANYNGENKVLYLLHRHWAPSELHIVDVLKDSEELITIKIHFGIRKFDVDWERGHIYVFGQVLDVDGTSYTDEKQYMFICDLRGNILVKPKLIASGDTINTAISKDGTLLAHQSSDFEINVIKLRFD